MKLLFVLLLSLAFAVAADVPDLSRQIARQNMQDYSESLAIFTQFLSLSVFLKVCLIPLEMAASSEFSQISGLILLVAYAYIAVFAFKVAPILYLRRSACTANLNSNALPVFIKDELTIISSIFLLSFLKSPRGLKRLYEAIRDGTDLRNVILYPISDETRNIIANDMDRFH